MKSPYFAFIGIVIGLALGIVGYPMLLSPSVYNEQNGEKKNELDTEIQPKDQSDNPEVLAQNAENSMEHKTLVMNPDTILGSRGITIGKADSLFQDYHQTRVPEESQGVLEVEVDNVMKKVTHFYLNYQDVVEPLATKIDAARDSTLIGFAGILAFDSDNNSHTMMWVAVVEAADGESYYYLPKNYDANEKSYVYDYVSICPENCPLNEGRLWNEKWDK